MALDLQRSGKLDDALEICRRIVAAAPDRPDVWHLLGVLAAQTGKGAEAVECITRAVELDPRSAEAHINLGNALNLQEQWDAAVASYRRAIELRPDSAQAHCGLGAVLRKRNKLAEAIASFQTALSFNPSDAPTLNNLGLAFFDAGQIDNALAAYQRALAIQPSWAQIHNNLGLLLRDQGRPGEAENCFRKAIELNPKSAGPYFGLGSALRDQARLDEAIEAYRNSTALDPGFYPAYGSLLYTLYFHPAYDAAAIYEEHRRWNEQHAAPLARFIQPLANDRSPVRRLRVGYVSSDFREHAQSFFTLPLFAQHDHQQFEVFCYADVPRADDITGRLMPLADACRDIAGLTDDQVAQTIRDDRIDILIDLSMHMARSRVLVFARKPAPVQVCWLAYPGTTGLTTIDYRLTDPYLDPPGLDDRYYTEESISLADSFWCYDPLTNEPAVNSLPAMEKGYITFGSLNNFCKVNDDVLKLWARVLSAVDRSRLLLLAPEGACRQRTLSLLEAQGVTRDRVDFVGFQPRLRYLELYHQIDIGLDTFPANGHTTSMDSLWMGVPIVTLVGRTAIGRGGVSIMRNIGLPELIAQTPDQFVEVAARLAVDLARLGELRNDLRARMQRSPLMDAPRFARNMEAAYRSMWQRWCAGVKQTQRGHKR